jgi:hypothetical protein
MAVTTRQLALVVVVVVVVETVVDLVHFPVSTTTEVQVLLV